MSKVDAQRAIREARYEAYRKARAAGGAAPAPAKPAPAKPVATPAAVAEPAPESEAGPALCGHKGGAGKPCTRPAGHPEKSHRYK